MGNRESTSSQSSQHGNVDNSNGNRPVAAIIAPQPPPISPPTQNDKDGAPPKPG